MGLYTQRAPGLRRRQDRDARGGGARRRLLHDAGPLRRRSCSPPTQCARSAASAATSPATPPTSPTARTSSTTGSGSRTSRRSGSGSTPPAWTAIEACGDSPRPFLGSPVAGVAKDEIIDGTAALEEIKRRYIGNPEFSNLPRKFKTALTGHPSHDVVPRDQRRLLRRHRAPRARPRLRPLGRRRAVHQPDARPEARRLDPARRGAPTPGRASPRSSATTATAGCARGPG